MNRTKEPSTVTGDLNPTLTFEWALEIPDFEHLVGQRGGGYVLVSRRWAGGCSPSSSCRWAWACLTLVKQNSGWISRETGLVVKCKKRACEIQRMYLRTLLSNANTRPALAKHVTSLSSFHSLPILRGRCNYFYTDFTNEETQAQRG